MPAVTPASGVGGKLGLVFCGASIGTIPAGGAGIAGAAFASINPALASMASAIGATAGCMAIWFAAFVPLKKLVTFCTPNTQYTQLWR